MKHHMKRLFTILSSLVLAGTMAFPSGASLPAVPSQATASQQDDEAFKKERRIFLWDVTISMVGATASEGQGIVKGSKRSNPDFDYTKSQFPNYNKSKDIFDETRDKLIKMIMQIQNESTEIIILPFRNGIVGEYKAVATANGKNQVCDYIRTWNDLKAGGTHTATSLSNAVDKYFTPDRINRLFLLTDGEPSDNEGSRLLSYLRNWKGVKETRGSSSYLVYVMLTDEAYNDEIVQIGENSGGDITVTRDFQEPVWITIGHNSSVHVRDFLEGKVSSNGKGTFEVPFTFIAGNALPANSVFHFSVEENEFISIDPSAAVKASDGKLSVPFSLKKSSVEEYLSSMPADGEVVVRALCTKDPSSDKNLSLTGSNAVNVSLVIKAQPRATISWSVK